MSRSGATSSSTPGVHPESGFEVTGPVTVDLWITTSAVDTDFTANLTNLAPDGRSTNVCDGVTWLRFRPEARGSSHRARFSVSPSN